MRTFFVFISFFAAQSTYAANAQVKLETQTAKSALSFLSPSHLEILEEVYIGDWQDIEYA